MKHTSNKHHKSRKPKIGLPPGTPVYLGQDRDVKIKIEVYQYNEKEVYKHENIAPVDFKEYVKDGFITWINIDGIHDNTVVKYVGEQFGLHPLTMEDIVNSDHRPKIDYYETYLHFTLKMLWYEADKKCISKEQVSIILGKNFVISFQEIPGDIFDPIRERILTGKGRARTKKADYLAYALMDIIVDNYFLITDHLELEIDQIEHKLLTGADKEDLETILKVKKDLVFLKKSVIPVREAISSLQKSESDLIDPGTKQFLRDIYDHTIHISESIENYKEMLQGFLDIYLTGLSNKLNQVMKTLTVISTIFIPLTFIAGLYGMNFNRIPGADHPDGFLISTIVMLAGGLIMGIILYRKKWF